MGLSPSLKFLGTVSTEGGPLLLVDPLHLNDWTGAEGGDFDDVCAFLDNHPESVGLSVTLGDRSAVIWDMGGAGTADVYRVGSNQLALHRRWPDSPDGFDSGPRLPESGRELGRLDVASGQVLVFWSVERGSGIDMPADGFDGMSVDLAGARGAGLLMELAVGSYVAWTAEEPHQRWCWIEHS